MIRIMAACALACGLPPCALAQPAGAGHGTLAGEPYGSVAVGGGNPAVAANPAGEPLENPATATENPAVAGDTAARVLTLAEAQRRARENYPLIRRYGLLEQTKGYNLANIARGWLPQVSATAQATVQSGVPELPDALRGMMQQMGNEVRGLGKGQYRMGIDVSQTLYDGGSIAARRHTAEAQADVDVAATGVDIHALRSRVCEVYFGILLLDGQLRLNAEAQALLLASEQRLQTLAGGGMALPADVATLRAERLQAIQRQKVLETQRHTLKTLLTAYTGCEVDSVECPPCLRVDGGGFCESLENDGGNKRIYNNHIINNSYNKDNLGVGSDESVKSVADFGKSAADSCRCVGESGKGATNLAVPGSCGSANHRLFDARAAMVLARERELRSTLMPRLGIFAQAYYGYSGMDMFADMMRRQPSLNAMAGLRLTWNIGGLYTYRNHRARLAAERQQIEVARATFDFNRGLRERVQGGTVEQWQAMLREDGEIVSLRREVRLATEARLANGAATAADLVRDIAAENQARIDRAVHELEMRKAEYELQNIMEE